MVCRMTKKEKVNLFPKPLVNYFYDRVKFGTAIFVVILAVIIESILLAVIGFANITKYFLLSLFSSLIVDWLFVAIILYIIMYLIKGRKKTKKDSFLKILSGLASFRIVTIFFMLLSFLVSLVFLPKVLVYLKQFSVNPAIVFSSTAIPVLGSWAVLGFILLFILVIALVIYYLVMFYYFVAKMYNVKQWWKIIILMIIIFFIIYLINIIF